MSNLHLIFKLSTLPWLKSPLLQSLIAVAIAQLLFGAWLGGAIDQEIRKTEKFANTAKWITVQLKNDKQEPLKELFDGLDVSYEELSTEDVLSRMEPEEPEVVQTVKAMGKEGLQLVPKVILVRGVVPDEIIEKIKLLTEVLRVDASPVHHHRLLTFYRHLQVEMRIGMAMILFLIGVIFLTLQRIQLRDLKEVRANLLAWGTSQAPARLPLFFSLGSVFFFAGFLSLVEWGFFKKLLWKSNPFLGELSIDRTFHFPFIVLIAVACSVLVYISILSFSGRATEE